jgi:hypothetical protein
MLYRSSDKKDLLAVVKIVCYAISMTGHADEMANEVAAKVRVA